MSNLIPEPMDSDTLVALLTDVLARVREGDSWEGNVEWSLPDPDAPPGTEFMVRGVYRIGNAFGQGGVRMIGTVPPTPMPVSEWDRHLNVENDPER